MKYGFNCRHFFFYVSETATKLLKAKQIGGRGGWCKKASVNRFIVCDWTYFNVTRFSAGTLSAIKFFIFLILSRDTRSAPTLLFSFVDVDVHSRNMANIRSFCCAAKKRKERKKGEEEKNKDGK